MSDETTELTFDPEAVTFGELEDFEEYTGSALFDLPGMNGSGEFDIKALSTKQLTGFMFLVRRQSDPDFTLEQARNLRLSDLNIEIRTDPTEGGTSTS